MAIPFGRDAPRGQAGQPRCYDQRSIGACEDLAEDLDDAPIGIGCALHVAGKDAVMHEGEVDDAIGGVGRLSQDLEIVEAAALHLDAGGR